jgi:hypothetical protein
MKQLKILIAGGAIALAATGCSSTGGSPEAPSSPAPIASNVLQFAVGTANLYGTPGAGINVVATYRQPKGGFKPGDSGAAVDSPTLTLPANLAGTAGTSAGFDGCSTVLSGPATGEIGTSSMTSTTQNPGANCTTTQTTFGQSGGVFALGIEPFNAAAQGDFTPPGPNNNGLPFQVAPYPVPLYAGANAAAGTNGFTPWGGPPAFKYGGSPDSVVGSTANTVPAGTAGVSEGIDVFAGVTPVAGGAYTLSVNVPANTGAVTQKATFTMPAALTNLGTATAPAFVPDGSGGGTFAFTMPAGATEAFLQITDFGPNPPPTPSTPQALSCNGWASTATPIYYTIEATASGTLTLPDKIGPTAPSSINPNGAAQNSVTSVCTAAQNTAANGGTATAGDMVQVQVIGFDYDAFGINPLNSQGNPSPAIAAANASADITVSAAACQYDSGGGTQASCTGSLPLIRRAARTGIHSVHVR